MIKTVTYHQEHIKLFTPAAGFAKDIAHHPNGIPCQYGHTLLLGNEILGCVGGNVYWNGVAEVWAFFSESIRKYPLEFTKTVRRLVAFYEQELILHRMHFYVREEFEMAMRWAKTLGFKNEGLMKCFGIDGSNYFMFARTN